MKRPLVLILVGSERDVGVMKETSKVLDHFEVASELVVASAHRTPKKVAQLAAEAASKGVKVIIAGAGMAAHLAGAVAANTTIPVIGVPLDVSPFKGLDALLSTMQMPVGVPVASMAIGKAGAKNAALFAVQILALSDTYLARAFAGYKADLAR